jgi:KipI family sensor histidine kinase inhibitor
MLTAPPRVLALGDAALTVEFGSEIAPEIHARVLGFAQALEAAVARGALAGVVEWVPAYRSLTVYFDPAAELDDPATQAEILLALARQAPAVAPAGRRWRIPVCFDAAFAPDLDALAAAKGLTRAAVITLLTATPFRVYMLGFLPGFPYLGGLPEALALPRRATPRTAVPARSLAVAGRMCSVYPWESPGGWHLLGRTPVRLFDADHAADPALFHPGDEIRWVAIDRDTYEALERRAATGGLERGSLLVESEAQP